MAFKIRSKYIQRIIYTKNERKCQIKGKYVVIYVYSVERKVISSQVFTSSFEYHTNMSMCVLSQFINLPSFCHKAYTNIHKEPTSINVSYSSTSYAVMCSHCNQPNLSILVPFCTTEVKVKDMHASQSIMDVKYIYLRSEKNITYI